MSNYNYTDTFLGLDELSTGNPAKVIKAAAFHAEFNAVETAVNSKADVANATLTGTTTAATLNVTGTLTAGTIDGGTY